MSEYVDDENRLECWGGLDTWEYKWVSSITFYSLKA